MIKELFRRQWKTGQKEYEIAVYDIYSDLGKPEQILTDRFERDDE